MALDWKSIIKTAAPFLGTALGGPLGGAAGKLIATALGGDETKATPDDLAKLVQNVTPEQLLALKNADQAYQVQLKQLNINEVKDLEALAVQDRESARNREIQVKDHTPAIGFYLITAGFFGFLTALLFLPIPESNKAVLYVMIGSLGTAWVGCTSYYYGTTRSSGLKDHMLYNSTPTDQGK